MSIEQEFLRILTDTANRLGILLEKSGGEVRDYVSGQTRLLSRAVDEPGYDRILVAAGLNVASFAAGESVDIADRADAEFIGVVTGALGLAARALVA